MKKQLLSFVLFGVCSALFGADVLFRDFTPEIAKVKENRKSQEVFVKKSPALLLDSRYPSTGNHVGQVFYFTKKERDALKGKTVKLKFKAKRLAGSHSLLAGFRLLERQTWRALGHRYDKVALPRKNVWYDCEVPYFIPDLPTMGSNNINFQLGTGGRENSAIVIDDIKVYTTTEEDKFTFEECASLGRAQRLNKTPLFLVKDGKPLFTIVVPAKANDIAVIAAQELRHHFFLATGKKVPIVNDKPVKTPAIHVGDTALARRYGVAPAMLPKEHYVMARVGKDIILSGGDGENVKKNNYLSLAGIPLGTLNAVYGFLEQYLGVRWYWPGDRGMVIPPCKDIVINRLYQNGQPYFSTRTLYTSTFPRTDEINGVEQAVWKRRLRLGGKVLSPIANHGFYWLYEKYADKPELFALQKDGKRRVSQDMGVHVCFSNPELLKITVKEALEYFRKNPQQSFFRVMPGDVFPGCICNCADCQKLYKPERGELGSGSDMVWGFVNEVAKQVSAKLPGKYINCCAYESYKLPPSFPLSGNVSVTLCHGWVPRAGLDEKESLKKVLDLWEPTGARLYVWEYWLVRNDRSSWGAPVIFSRHLEEMSAMKRSRIAGGVIELSGRAADGTGAKGWGQWEYDMPAFYFSARLMWNTPFDMEEELERFYNGFFGPAADEMRKFHENFEDAWDKSFVKDKDGGRFWDHRVCWQHVYSPRFVKQQMDLLRQAVKKAGKQQPYAWRLGRMLKVYSGFENNSRKFSQKVKLNPSVLNVRKTAKVPVIDGKINAKEWQNSVVAGNFLDSFAVYAALSKTEVRVMHDNKFLYLGIKAYPDKGSEVLFPNDKWGKRDPALWFCDSVECFIASDSGEYYQYIFGTGDRLFDGHKKKGGKLDSSWTSKAVVKTNRSGNDWTCEVKIPLSELKFSPAMKRGTFKVNFSRNHYRRKKGTAGKFFWEQTGWQPTYGAFSNTEKFGTLNLK